MSYDINEEWMNFISSDYADDDISDNEFEDINNFIKKDEEISANLSFDFNSVNLFNLLIFIKSKLLVFWRKYVCHSLYRIS